MGMKLEVMSIPEASTQKWALISYILSLLLTVIDFILSFWVFMDRMLEFFRKSRFLCLSSLRRRRL